MHIWDSPGNNPKGYSNDPRVAPGYSENYLWGKWNYQKDSMHASRPNTLSNSFSKNQIKIMEDTIRRIIRQEMRENRDYYYDSGDTYNDQKSLM